MLLQLSISLLNILLKLQTFQHKLYKHEFFKIEKKLLVQ